MKKIINLILAICLIIPCFFIFYACNEKQDPPKTYAWDGTSDISWYNDTDITFTLTTEEQLAGLAGLVNTGKNFVGKTIVLGNDLDLEGHNWIPIGNFEKDTNLRTNVFKGTFDGNNKTIKNISCETSATSGKNYSCGLFGASVSAEIKNLTIQGSIFKGNHFVAAIVGHGDYIEITNCKVVNCEINNVFATEDANGDKAGTILGLSFECVIMNTSASNCTVSADRDAGQLVGTTSDHRAAYATKLQGCTTFNVEVLYNRTGLGNSLKTGQNIKNEFIGRVSDKDPIIIS